MALIVSVKQQEQWSGNQPAEQISMISLHELQYAPDMAATFPSSQTPYMDLLMQEDCFSTEPQLYDQGVDIGELSMRNDDKMHGDLDDEFKQFSCFLEEELVDAEEMSATHPPVDHKDCSISKNFGLGLPVAGMKQHEQWSGNIQVDQVSMISLHELQSTPDMAATQVPEVPTMFHDLWSSPWEWPPTQTHWLNSLGWKSRQ